MGYGIKLLVTQPAYLPTILDGKADGSGYDKCIIENVRRIYEIDDKLFRLSGYTISFIGSCDKLFNICKVDDDDDGDFWDWIYTWRGKYYDMEWDELKSIIQPLINKYAVEYENGFDEEEQLDCLNDLEILFSIIDITRTFKIS